MTRLEFDVEAKTWLRPSTYRALHRHAQETGTSVGYLLARIADKAVEPKQQQVPRRPYQRMTPQLIERAAALYRSGMLWREIAQELGVSTSSLANHKTQIVNERTS